jgi:hypothetical protein
MNTVTSKDGTKIPFEQKGEGNPLILVGGALDSGTRSLPTLLLRDAAFDFVREAMNVLAKAISQASQQVLEHGVTAETLAPVLTEFFNNEEGK